MPTHEEFEKKIEDEHEEKQKAIDLFRCRSVGESFTSSDWQAREYLLGLWDFIYSKEAEAELEDIIKKGDL